MTPEGGARRGPGLSLLVLGATVVGAHLALFPRLASIDGFYHVGHAARYLDAGPFDTAFPWATQSIIGDVGADLWWGFHVVLMPFAALGDPGLGALVAAPFLTGILAWAILGVLRRAGVAGAGWWTVLTLVAVPNVLYRWVMARPHVLSLAAALLLLEALCRGRRWHAAGAAAALTWIHLGMFWMPVGLVAAWVLARGILAMTGRGGAQGGGGGPDGPDRATHGGRVPSAAGSGRYGRAAVAGLDALAVLGGATVGWLLRPEAVGAAALARVQILELFSTKGTDQPLGFATELQALPPLELVRTSWFFLALWVVGVAGWWMAFRGGRDAGAHRAPAPADHRPLLATAALLCSGAFLVLALASSRRAQVEWVAFGALGVALTFPQVLGRSGVRGFVRRAGPEGRTPASDASTAEADRQAAQRGGAPRWLRMAFGILVLVHLPWAAHRHALNARAVAFPPNLLSGAAAWLQAYSEPGDIVFHVRWDDFGPLFARNRQNRYLSGMDPIFFHRHDPARYWEHFFLSQDLTTEYTCDAFPCAAGTATGTHEVVRDHFDARWLVVEPRRNPKLAAWLASADGFRLAVDTGREVVYEVMP